MTTVSEPLVSAPDTTVLYMARRRNLRLVKVPEYPVYGQGGRVIGSEPGQTLEFKDGVARVPIDGDVEFAHGRKVPAAEVHQWLEGHRLFGNIEEGFWGVPAIAPTVSQDEMNKMVQAALALDEDTLKAIVEQERAGWGREAIIAEAEGALAKIAEMRAAAAKEAEEQAAKEKAAGQGKATTPPKE